MSAGNEKCLVRETNVAEVRGGDEMEDHEGRAAVVVGEGTSTVRDASAMEFSAGDNDVRG